MPSRYAHFLSVTSSMRLATTCALLTLQCACLTTLDLGGDYADMPDTTTPDDGPSTDDGPMPPLDMAPDLEDASPDLARDTPEDLHPDMPDVPDMPRDTPADMPPVYAPGEGLFFSEVVEGSTGNNKFIELYNARASALPLEHVWLANFNASGDPDLSSVVPFHLGAKVSSIPAGEVIVLCHSMRDQLMGTGICDIETSTALNFNGDDPLALYYDADMDGMLTASDLLIDSFGQLDNTKPDTPIWANASYQRCNLTPYLGQALFSPEDYYLVESPETYTHLGTPPPQPSSCP